MEQRDYRRCTLKEKTKNFNKYMSVCYFKIKLFINKRYTCNAHKTHKMHVPHNLKLVLSNTLGASLLKFDFMLPFNFIQYICVVLVKKSYIIDKR